MRSAGAGAPPGGASLGVLDGVSVVVGIVVGVSLFKVPALVFGAVPGPVSGMGVWVLGGLLAGVGSLCYAELASAWPRSGGDVVYLSRAYGPAAGFLFGWAQLVAVLSGSIGAMAYVFADYAVAALGKGAPALWASAAIVALTLANTLGVGIGRTLQNGLTLSKVVGLGGVVAVGLWAAVAGGAPAGAATADPSGPGGAAWGFALVLVLYAYGGWNDAAFVAADVRDAPRNMARVLVGGTAAVVAIHLVVNAAYLAALGFDGVRASRAPAADVLRTVLGTGGSRAMSALVMVSALGAIQGLLFTGSRIYTAVGADHRAFAALARWSPRTGAPLRALAAQAAAALVLVLGVGTAPGRGALDAALGAVGLDALPWSRFGGGFDLLVAATAPVFWGFFGLTGAALLVLRRREPERPRPFRVPGHPWTPLLFCATCAGMLFASLEYARGLALLGLAPLLPGLLAYRWGRGRGMLGGD